MERDNLLDRIAELEEQVAALPCGSISTKKVKGKQYYYHRLTENKKRIEKYIPAEEVDALREQIRQRKELEAELIIVLTSHKNQFHKKDSS